MTQLSWDYRFLELAKHIAQWSKDPSTKVGAVIVRPDRTIASVGYNGFPRGVWDQAERYNDRQQKYPMVVHAEMNAILSSKEPLSGYTIYVNPVSPCATCSGAIIQSGIKRVVALAAIGSLPNWTEHTKITRLMYQEAEIRFEIL